MQKELVNQAMTMFDKDDKWNSFLELTSIKDEIIKKWYQKLKTTVTKKCCEEDVVNGWSFHAWTSWDFKWYLTEFGKESFCIWMWGSRIGLWANPNFHDSQKITDLLNSDKFSLIMSVLRHDEVFSGDWKLVEYGNFDFTSPYNSHFDEARLAWFAGNKSQELAEQIVVKVNKFRHNETITALFSELNRLTKK